MKEYEANFTLDLLKDYLSDEEVKFYKSTKDCIKVTYKDGTEVTYPILKGGTFTPWNCIRDCGSYYEWARYSDYLIIDKVTLKVFKLLDA